MFRLLEKKLIEIDFDYNRDRLFTTGDMCDRHPDSIEFWDWLHHPWFFSVRGNHEQMTIDSFREGPQSNACGMHYQNGGAWFYGIPTIEQQCYVEVMKELPYGIEIETKNGLVGIVHAEVGTWEMLRNANSKTWEGNNVVQTALWGRTRIAKKDTSNVEGLHKLYCGHTVVDSVTELGNVVYCDTGSVFTGNLAILQIN